IFHSPRVDTSKLALSTVNMKLLPLLFASFCVVASVFFSGLNAGYVNYCPSFPDDCAPGQSCCGYNSGHYSCCGGSTPVCCMGE
ncbi:hypothetical protein PFISCL1PPCAC_21602, partial [Pristionchus fissidentatus]